MAPPHDVAAVDVPGEVDEEVARREVVPEQVGEVAGLDLRADEVHALRDPRPQGVLVGLEFQDRDVTRIDAHVLEEDGERAAGDEPEADEDDPAVEGDHGLGRISCRGSRRP
jgi:hypothetical protein